MKLTKGTLRRIIKEESRRLTEKEEYKQFFKRALEKAGKSIPQMSDSEKKEFFNKIDKTWKGKNESINENSKKYFDVVFYYPDPSEWENYIIVSDKFSDLISQAIEIAKSDGTNYAEFFYKNFLIGSIHRRDRYKFKKGEDYRKSPLPVNESVNEAFKYHIKVNKPSEIKSKSVISQIEKLAKRGVRSKEIGLQMGFAGDSKLATDTFQKVKNRVYFDLDKRESVVSEKKVPKKGSADYHQHKIAVDTVRNPIKSFMGGPSWKEAEETLIKKFGYSKKEVDKLRESVNEAKSQDPTLKEMVKFLKSNYRDEEEFSILLAIYFYSEANYGGMRSNLYSALSQLSNKMRVRTKFSDERGTEIEMMVDDLVDEFGGERP